MLLDRARDAWEVGDGADERAQDVSGREGGGRGNGCAKTESGRPKKKRGRGEGEGGERAGGGELGQQARMRKGGGKKKKTFFFLFSRVLANHFRIDFVFNSNLIKTNHYKNKSAAACMRQEVTNLIFDFNFTKFINFLYLNAHIKT